MVIPKKTLTEIELVEFQENPLEFFIKLHQEYEDIVELDIGKATYVTPFKAEYIGKIIEEPKVGRTTFSKLFHPIAGGSIILSEGEVWKSQRKALSPFLFSPKINVEAVRRFALEAITHLENVDKDNVSTDARDAIVLYCMKVLSSMVFGHDIEDEVLMDIHHNWDLSLDCFTKTMGEGATELDVRNMEAACNNVELSLLEIISKKRHSKGDTSLLYTLISNPSFATDEEIMQNIKGLFVAGFETISNALMWFLSDLAHNPSWQKKIRSQVLDDMFRWDTNEGTMKLCYNETLRMHPPLVFIDRALRTDVDLIDFVLVEGTEVLICPYVVHRDTRYWKNPSSYSPDRTETERYLKANSYQYFPYGGGPMKCMGEKMSVIERNILIQELLTRYEIKVYNNQPTEVDDLLSLKPKKLLLELIEI